MRRYQLLLSAAAVAILANVGTSMGENWPNWRGPRGDGTSIETGIPVEWNGETGDGIQWKTALPGVGHSSPIVWRDRIYLVTCLEATNERDLLAIDRLTGQIEWQRTVIESPLETKHNLNSFASGTPATDGETIFTTFLEIDGHTIPAKNVSQERPVTVGRIVVAAHDRDGKQKWLVRPGEFVSVHGFCSSPVLFEDLVIVNGDHDGDSYVVALRRDSGETVWTVPREHKTRSYVTPLIREIDGRTQMVFSGSHRIVSLDPRTGSQHWLVEGPTEQFVASMVCDGRRFYMAAGFPTHHVVAVNAYGRGDVTETHVDWHSTDAKCYVPSPVLVGNDLFVADDRGTANCFDKNTGERIWQDRLGRHFSASLVTAGGLVYFLADDGIMKVVRPAKNLDVVATNRLGEWAYASPAISSGHLYLRGEKHLFSIGEDTSAASP